MVSIRETRINYLSFFSAVRSWFFMRKTNSSLVIVQLTVQLQWIMSLSECNCLTSWTVKSGKFLRIRSDSEESNNLQFAFFTDPIIQFILGGICIKTMDNQFPEAWYSPKSKQVVLFLCKEPPKTCCIMGSWKQSIPVYYFPSLYGCVSKGLGTTEFTKWIGWDQYWKRSRFSHLDRHLDR